MNMTHAYMGVCHFFLLDIAMCEDISIFCKNDILFCLWLSIITSGVLSKAGVYILPDVCECYNLLDIKDIVAVLIR